VHRWAWSDLHVREITIGSRFARVGLRPKKSDLELEARLSAVAAVNLLIIARFYGPNDGVDIFGQPFGTLAEMTAEADRWITTERAKTADIERRLAEPGLTDEDRTQSVADLKHQRFVAWSARDGDRTGEPPPDARPDFAPTLRCASCEAEYIAGTVLCAECTGTDLRSIAGP